MFYVVNAQNPTAQSLMAYDNELAAIVAYYNTLASNYSAYAAGTLTGFVVCILDSNLAQFENYYEKR